MKEESQNLKSDAALREEKILEFWHENKIFEKSLSKDSPKGEFVFYEGPPTANGKPGIHHLEARAFKDAIPRLKSTASPSLIKNAKRPSGNIWKCGINLPNASASGWTKSVRMLPIITTTSNLSGIS